MRFILASLFLILTGLIGPSSAMAGGYLVWGPNEIDRAECTYVVNNSTTFWEIGVHNVVNPEFEDQGSRSVTAITGFEFGLLTDPGMWIMGVTFPAPATNDGDFSNLRVSFDAPLPVSFEYTALATVELFIGGFAAEDIMSNPPTYPCTSEFKPAATTLYAAPRVVPTVPGRITVIDADDAADPVVVLDTRYGQGPGPENWFPEFTFRVMEDYVVPTEEQSWGAIKSLYR